MKEASEAVGRGRPAMASLTAERDGDGGMEGSSGAVVAIRVLSYTTALGGASEVSSAF